MIPTSTTRESRGSHLHPQSNTRIHLLPRKSKIHCKVKYASNVQRYNPAPLVLLVNSHWLIVSGHTPNVHLIPSGNANDQNKSILVHRPIWSPLPCNHSPSKFLDIPYLGRSIPWKGFLTSEGQTTKEYTYLKTIIPVIACSWQSMDTIGYRCPTMACSWMLYQHTVACYNSFCCWCECLSLVSTTQPSISCFLVPST